MDIPNERRQALDNSILESENVQLKGKIKSIPIYMDCLQLRKENARLRDKIDSDAKLIAEGRKIVEETLPIANGEAEWELVDKGNEWLEKVK